ncbi:Inherit from opiNOG: protein Hydra magnipapillata [Seminavis robusta]|uniref:Inherit from opiNOG: protein Hydra magnipapillata n=1 Tax=Seminavis robusta TaxID=568900 RepID=A0A9N8HL32_9STRA|nr:Inherit from opiNOG: protein Hydra magnipapillata [Seminavis robusta]|eukprot:Sro778_g201150.1 Inherit from opiNOG: protein Hydra magnipapillata (429) ;mRNA; f:22074-23598
MAKRGKNSTENTGRRAAADALLGLVGSLDSTPNDVQLDHGTAGNTAAGKVPVAGKHKPVRSLEELVDHGKLPTYKELRGVLHDETAALDYMAWCGIIKVPGCCGRCGSTVHWKKKLNKKSGAEEYTSTVECRKVVCEFTPPKTCERCDSRMNYVCNEDREVCGGACNQCHWTWSPGKKWQISPFRGSVLQNCKLPKNEVLHLFYLFLLRVPAVTIASMLSWSVTTVGKWLKHCRQLVTEMILREDKEKVLLGGPGIIVEIDESKFGTIIHTDMWKAYGRLQYLDGYNYTHKTLNHSKEFVSEDGTHTQTIEGSWSFMKAYMPVQKRSGHSLQEYLWEIQWRRLNAEHLWEAFLSGVSKWSYTPADIEKLWDLRDENDPAGWNADHEQDKTDEDLEDALYYDTDDELYNSDGEGSAAAATLTRIKTAII